MAENSTSKSLEIPDWIGAGCFGDALGLAVYAYVLAVLTGFQDSSFILNGPALRLDIGLDAPAGSISLPAVGVSVSLLDFFLFGPMFVLAVHLLLLAGLRRRLLEGAISGGQGTVLIALVAFAGPAVLLGSKHLRALCLDPPAGQWQGGLDASGTLRGHHSRGARDRCPSSPPGRSAGYTGPVAARAAARCSAF